MRWRKYNDKDYSTLESWMAARKMVMPKRSFLPKRGFIVDNVTCFFLIKTDCKIGILEYFIANPKASVQDVAKAIDIMIPECEKIARELGMEEIIGNTCLPNVCAHGLRCGYKSDGRLYFYFRKNIGEKHERRERGTIHRSGDAAATGIDGR